MSTSEPHDDRAGAPVIDYGERLCAGVILPSGNRVAEAEIHAMLPPGVRALVTRLALRGSSEAELMAMIDNLEAAAQLVADAGVDVIVFHCTAVSTFAPELAQTIRERIERATGIAAFTTGEAIAEALVACPARRINLLTPYNTAVHEREIRFLEALGMDVVHHAHLGIETNTEMATWRPEQLERWAAEHIEVPADAVFLSCTAIKTAGLIESLEAQTGVPVLTSNQAMVWHLLRSREINQPVAGFGRLLASPR